MKTISFHLLYIFIFAVLQNFQGTIYQFRPIVISQLLKDPEVLFLLFSRARCLLFNHLIGTNYNCNSPWQLGSYIIFKILLVVLCRSALYALPVHVYALVSLKYANKLELRLQARCLDNLLKLLWQLCCEINGPITARKGQHAL